MSLIGKVLMKYKDEFTKKHLEEQSYRNDSISYRHHDRMDKLFATRFVLALRNSHGIYNFIRNKYREMVSPEHVVNDIIDKVTADTEYVSFHIHRIANKSVCGYFLEVDWVALDFDEKDVKGKELFVVDLYIPKLEEELLWHVKRVFKDIESHNLKLEL